MPMFSLDRAESLWWWSAALLLILFVATLAVSAGDQRQLDGASVWAKPLKFQAALAVHFATLAMLAALLGPELRDGALLRWTAIAAIVCGAFEIAYITLQAGRGLPSHFNVSTPLASALYSAMAFGAFVLTVAAAVVGVALLVDRTAAIDPALRLGAVIGLIGGTVLTLIIAFRMGGAMTHHVGIEPAGAARMPITGWSLSVGDRRVPHFFAIHMMQAVPLAGLIAGLMLPRMAALGATLAFGLGWAGLTWALYLQANAGRPIYAAG